MAALSDIMAHYFYVRVYFKKSLLLPANKPHGTPLPCRGVPCGLLSRDSGLFQVDSFIQVSQVLNFLVVKVVKGVKVVKDNSLIPYTSLRSMESEFARPIDLGRQID